MRPTPRASSSPIAPIFKADSVSLHVSREKDGKLRLVYAGWEDAKVVQPDAGKLAAGGGADLTPPAGQALTP
jgi:hypothetical protein